MDDTQRRLDDMGGSIGDVESLEKQLEETKARCTQLEQEVTDARRRQRREALDRLNAGRAELQRSSEEHDAAMTLLSHRREELGASPFGSREPEELEAEVQADLNELEELRAEAARKPKPLWGIVLMVLAVAAAALYTSLDVLAFMIAAAVFCVGAIVMLLRYGKERGAAAAALERQTALLRKYQARSTGEIKAALEDYEQLWESAKEAEQQELHTRRAYESARSMQSRLEESALGELDFASGDSETARLGRELTAARGEAERLSPADRRDKRTARRDGRPARPFQQPELHEGGVRAHMRRVRRDKPRHRHTARSGHRDTEPLLPGARARRPRATCPP